MTTIVVDRKVGFMAGDRKVTSNDGEYAFACKTKILRVKVGGDQYLVGLAGLEGPGWVFMDWFENGEWDEPPDPMPEIDEEDAFTILVLDCDNHELFAVDKFMRMDPIDCRWYGAGSGGPIAWAVLEAGCGIQKAMPVALRLDNNSGFGYEVKYTDGTDELYE